MNLFFCLLPFASCLLPPASCLLPPASCLLPPTSVKIAPNRDMIWFTWHDIPFFLPFFPIVTFRPVRVKFFLL